MSFLRKTRNIFGRKKEEEEEEVVNEENEEVVDEENEEEEESTENQYRRFYSAVHRRYILTDEGMCTIVLTAIVCDIDTSSGQWVIRSVSLLSLFERASLSSCTA